MVANRLLSERIDAIYCSPLERAQQTVGVVLEELERWGLFPGVLTDPSLRELELPGWEGRTYEAVRIGQSKDLAMFRKSPASFQLERADGSRVWPVLELEMRVLTLLDRLVREHPGSNLLLVTHGGPARILLLAALGLDLNYFHSVQQSHAGLSLVSVSPGRREISLELLNETYHSGEFLPKLKEGKSGLRLLFAATDNTIANHPGGDAELAQLLKSLPVHRVLAAGSDGVIMAMRLLRYRGSVTIETCSEAALQNSLENQLRRSQSEKPFNLLITGRSDLLTGSLASCLQSGNGKYPMKIALRSGLSVVHIPATNCQPILQAMNTHQGSCEIAAGVA
jgi:probable phosphoglycerate mutase